MKNSIFSLLKLFRWRFAKFGLVGLSGVPVNILVLYVSKEYLFENIQLDYYGVNVGLNLSLFVAIFCSIINNFYWNNRWTWRDRKSTEQSLYSLSRFSQYALASWMGVAIQIAITNILVGAEIHYIVSNMIAIIIASIFNYTINDRWTFRQAKSQVEQKRRMRG